MLMMILKMTAVTSLYVLLTMLLWLRTHSKPLSVTHKVTIGVIFGLCAVLSTHFGVDYSDMMLNVRDMGPLSAGLFFDPVSGVIAGLIGGIEQGLITIGSGIFFGLILLFVEILCLK
jgi:LytS/YehU family sensor histidine kinase